jgi:hypothetical protein
MDPIKNCHKLILGNFKPIRNISVSQRNNKKYSFKGGFIYLRDMINITIPQSLGGMIIER